LEVEKISVDTIRGGGEFVKRRGNVKDKGTRKRKEKKESVEATNAAPSTGKSANCTVQCT
jgi:hypothetical protein